MRNSIFIAALAALSALSTHALALNSVGPFSGTTDGFESYPTYADNGYQGVYSLTVLGGAATFSANYEGMWVINPSQYASWGLGGNGVASAYEGEQALGLFNNNSSVPVTLTFATPVSEFGAYWETCDPSYGPVDLSFYDASGDLLGTDSFVFDTGAYQWEGWADSAGIASVVLSGNAAPVLDNLTIPGGSSSSTPSPAALPVFGASLIGFARRRAKKA